MGAINNLNAPPRRVEKPFRLSISDVYKDLATGLTVTGKVFFFFEKKNLFHKNSKINSFQ